MSWMLVPIALFGLTGWRWVIIFGALCSLIIWVIRKKLPESARWLEEKGRHEEAHKVMCEMEQRCGVSPSPRHRIETQHNRRRLGSFKAIWAPQYRKRTIMLMVMNFFGPLASLASATGCPPCFPVRGEHYPQPAVRVLYYPRLSDWLPVLHPLRPSF